MCTGIYTTDWLKVHDTLVAIQVCQRPTTDKASVDRYWVGWKCGECLSIATVSTLFLHAVPVYTVFVFCEVKISQMVPNHEIITNFKPCKIFPLYGSVYAIVSDIFHQREVSAGIGPTQPLKCIWPCTHPVVCTYTYSLVGSSLLTCAVT